MSLAAGIHPDDLRKYDNETLADMYHVSLRTVGRARERSGIKKEVDVPTFTEEQYRTHTLQGLADELGVTVHYIRKYAKEQGWRK